VETAKLNENSSHYFHKTLLASFEISYLVAKNKKPHITGEALLLPKAIKMCEIMHDENYGQALKTVPLYNKTMVRLIESMSENIREQLLAQINVVQNFHFKLTNQQMLQVYLSYLCLSDTALKKKTFKKI
jgi:hypothetical protein